MKKMILRLFLSLGCLLLFSSGASAGDVHVSVAASLKEAMNDLSDTFARKNAGVRIVRNFGASGTLAKQIEQGAPADLFISANTEWMEYLRNRKLVDPSGVGTFCYNTLVFAGSTDKKIESMQDLSKLDRIAIGSPKSVPAGEYAMEAIRKTGMETQLEKKLVMARDVRACLMYAERGEADGAFVYRTDVLQSKQTKIYFAVPQHLYPRVTYPMGLTVTGMKNRDAQAFHHFVQSAQARAILQKYGFIVR